MGALRQSKLTTESLRKPVTTETRKLDAYGRDPRSPVWWERYETHGSFHYNSAQGPVYWIPGPKAPDQPEDTVGLLRMIGAKFE